MLQITERAIKNGQSIETYGSQDEEKQTKTTTQLEVKTNRTSFYAEIIADITTQPAVFTYL